MDDNDREMAALRRSQKFRAHQSKYGDRSAARREREKEEARLKAEMELDREKRAAAAAQRKEEIAKATEEMMSSLPASFGAKKDDGGKDIHRKRKLEAFTQPSASQDQIDATMANLKKLQLPVSCEIVLNHGQKVISAMGLDPRGGRLLTGGYDYTVKMWDFAGMTRTLENFRELEPKEGHVIRQLRYCKGGKFLCITGYRCASIFTRDGHMEHEYNRGDMYIHDLQHTVGHVAALTDGHWNPKNDAEFLTASEDGSMRIWDVNTERRSKEYIKLKPRGGGKRVPVTACCFSPNGDMIAGAGRMGSVQIWERKQQRVSPRAKKKVYKAHEPQTETSCVVFASDNRALASRGGDGTLKLWDVRKFKKPVVEWKKDLPNDYPTSDVAFSPKGDLIICGTTSKAPGDKKAGRGGELVFFSRKTRKEVQRVRVCSASVVRVIWNAKLNQIFCGCSDGATRVLYDPELSRNGALLCVKKKPKRKSAMDFSTFLHIKNPNALPLFAETQNPKRIRQKKRADPVASKKPLEPLKGEGTGGRVGLHNLTTHLMECMAKKNLRNEDPREALLAWDEKAKADPMFFGNAYKDSQPNQIYEEDKDEDEDEESEQIKELKRKISSTPMGADPEAHRKDWK